jgi:hypothetical protein
MKTWLSGDVSERLTPGGGAETAQELEVEVEQIQARLAANEAERKDPEAALRDLLSRRAATAMTSSRSLHGWRRGGVVDIVRSATQLSRPPLQQNRLDTRENRDVPIIDFVDDGHPALLRNGSRARTGDMGSR